MMRTFNRSRPAVHPKAFVHDSAEVIGAVTVKSGASIWPLAVLRGDVNKIVIGERTNVQDLTVIHCREGHPTILGRGITVGHNVVLHGARIDDGCLIGMGTIVMEAKIGRQSLVAAGSLVLAGAKFPPRSLIMGRPAKAIRKLNAAELRSLKQSEISYVQLMTRHRSTSKLSIS